ncbi:Cephalosporin hydroxylase [Methylobacterium sp. 275MFSha3.1]|uniref:cephalosporin hydroxylase family protein n=1 Tax=Methylobacterium sp. 275MFSha3.1 TaxID=1502746 RepID=UPI0008A78733|nr:CmcI family methyltransferase [Methylobacterium sp. 275MFSha3.1]SEI12513.1 Cephalosporin hydroxylase [Methylobacterium sp. 275MFSha3.1]
MNAEREFAEQNRRKIEALGSDPEMTRLSREWFRRASRHNYSYHFSWMGRPIIQFPQDIIAIQEIIWNVKPDVVIETGVAHGGSLIFLSSMLELLGPGRRVIGIDIDIREHNRRAITEHPMSKNITLIEGNSCSAEVQDQVRTLVNKDQKSVVILDSNHTRDHVLCELRAYEKYVAKGSYLIVLDTIIDYMDEEFSANKPWGPGSGPAPAVEEFLKENTRFAPVFEIDNKLQISVGPGGYLQCIEDLRS